MEFDNENEAEDAKEALNKKDFGGQPLNLGKYSINISLICNCQKSGAKSQRNLNPINRQDPQASKSFFQILKLLIAGSARRGATTVTKLATTLESADHAGNSIKNSIIFTDI